MYGRQYAASTVARKTAAIKSFCHYLDEHGQLARTLAFVGSAPSQIDTFRGRSPSRKSIVCWRSRRDAARSRRPDALRDQAMIETLYSSGMRVSELVALNVQDIDFDTNQVACPGKGGRSRQVRCAAKRLRHSTIYLENGRRRSPIRTNRRFRESSRFSG